MISSISMKSMSFYNLLFDCLLDIKAIKLYKDAKNKEKLTIAMCSNTTQNGNSEKLKIWVIGKYYNSQML